MYKGLLKTLALVLLCVLTFGCGSKYIGQRVNPSRSNQYLISETLEGHYAFNHKQIIVEYDYSVNPSRTKIALEGYFKFKQEAIHDGAELTEFYIWFFFVDHNDVVVEVQIKPYHGITSMDTIIHSFKFDAPYKDTYKSILCGCSYKGWA